MASTPASPASLTPAQQRVIAARGNVLVLAGAGTGKTSTLVERCLHCLEHDGAAVDELLVVTFTEAAAAGLRERLRRAIEARAHDASAPPPDFWAAQLARFDLAHIGTLHSFCFRFVREHFYELGLDPRLTLLDEGEARQLANETLDGQFAAHYAGTDAFSLAVQDLIQSHGGGHDDLIGRLVLQLHHHSQTRPDAAGWLARQRETFSSAEPADWLRWLHAAIEHWRGEWLPVLEGLQTGNEKAAELAVMLSRLAPSNHQDAWRKNAAAVLAQILAADGAWPAKRKTVLRQPLAELFTEAEFLHSLAEIKNGADPLQEDWSWLRGQLETLLRLAGQFEQRLAERKQANGVLDFHDLEQFALRLLWDFSTGRPTAIAAGWRAKLKFVFVDEYQDINAAQDKIIQGLSRDGTSPAVPSDGGPAEDIPAPPRANRFLVGDVKQSIYRFRLADPAIFRDYARTWHGAAGETIPLSLNFRSHGRLLHFVNSLFRLVMREEIGGVAYDRDAELKPGVTPAAAEPGAAPRATLLLRFKAGRGETREDDGELAGLADTAREARLIAQRLQQLVAARTIIFDDDRKISRPVEWRDLAILLRSPRGRAEIFAREFERAGIPLAVARGGFYESAEILDLVSLLQLLDNPLQDVPCLAVLRSPFVSLSLDELAEIRLAAREKHFWTALHRSAELGIKAPETAAKVSRFRERFSRWRGLARLVSLSQCLDEVLAETCYTEWLRAQPRGALRAANVAGFLRLARQFDQFQRQGLFRFLKFIAAQQQAGAEPEAPVLAAENAVRLMSIHQSKGLEFPVVVLADLTRQFNERDLHGDIIFDEEFGPCPKVKPPHLGRRYPSLPYWLARRRQKRELRGEELRLFYVALTRAREHLILTASLSEKTWDEKWTQPQPATPQTIARARCFADWLALWFSNQIQNPKSGVPNQTAGSFENLRWQIVSEADVGENLPDRRLDGEAQTRAGAESAPPPPGARQEPGALRARLERPYLFPAATRHKAKSSVTALRREAEELDDEAEPMFSEPSLLQRLKGGGKSGLSAAAIGAAHHKFLQWVALEKTGELVAEADRLARENYLSPEERAALDLDALAAFWDSPLGRKIRTHARDVQRELPFTARFSPVEIAGLTGVPAETGLEQEFVVIQGVADLVVLRPADLWLVDFKTDAVSAAGLPEKIKIYSLQLQLYAAALEKTFSRPVSVQVLHFLALHHTQHLGAER